ncbi:hypothetical protein CPB84DRAFT_1678414 [Gymnopilus junonius]|uniref:Hypervirulence associated protein TUDOR domain-containing protein n=1 Tax=Gymnopilus junonius TaxID=109634 RepID=A0A9P5NQG9_GYMJU|nr:hypothetical protein CPB84DRAFT_1678414 [Gymnopilus junonius]
MSSKTVYDKNGKEISPGDLVTIKIRGGHQEGRVEKIVHTEADAEKEDVKHPPKVIYVDQHGHRVNHNPGSLEDLDKD